MFKFYYGFLLILLKLIMKKVCQFLKDAGTYYLATMDGDQPRVRPFGTAHIFEDKLYIQTGKGKAVAKQINANPRVEICAMKGDEWIRIEGTLVLDDRVGAQESMLDDYPRSAKCTRQVPTATQRYIISRTLRRQFTRSPMSLL